MRIFLPVFLSLLFVVSALAKIGELPSSLRHRERMGVASWLWKLTGWAQLAGVAALWAGIFDQRIQLVAGVWLTVIMLGAGIAHLRVGDAWHYYVTVISLLLLSLTTIFLT